MTRRCGVCTSKILFTNVKVVGWFLTDYSENIITNSRRLQRILRHNLMFKVSCSRAMIRWDVKGLTMLASTEKKTVRQRLRPLSEYSDAQIQDHNQASKARLFTGTIWKQPKGIYWKLEESQADECHMQKFGSHSQGLSQESEIKFCLCHYTESPWRISTSI